MPLSEALAGRMSFLDFIEPVISSAIRWFGGLMIWLWAVIVWWTCGFYSEEPPPPPPKRIVSRFPKCISDLEKDALSLTDGINRLSKDVSKLRDTTELDKRLDNIRQFIEYRKDTENFKAKIDAGGWAGHLEEYKAKVKISKDRDELHMLRDELKKFVLMIKTLMQGLLVNEEKLAGFRQFTSGKQAQISSKASMNQGTRML